MSRFKEHLKKYKWLYISGGVILLAGTTTLILRGKLSDLGISRGISVTASRGISVTGENPDPIFNNLINIRGDNNTMHVTQVVESLRRGAPSWVVRCQETGEAFMSQRAAAIAMGLSEAELSKHLNGVMDNVRGYHFDRICMAA